MAGKRKVSSVLDAEDESRSRSTKKARLTATNEDAAAGSAPTSAPTADPVPPRPDSTSAPQAPALAEQPAAPAPEAPPTADELPAPDDQPVAPAPKAPKPGKKPQKPPKAPPVHAGLGPKAPPARIRKLDPPKPVVAEGEKNSVCVTRKTKLGAYLRRCRQLFDDGHTSIRLYALGAAIPHLTLLATSLPVSLPGGILRQEVTTSTVTCVDEIEPEDEEIDMSMRTRGKAAMQIVVWLREEEAVKGKAKEKGGKRVGGQVKGGGKGKERAHGGEQVRKGKQKEKGAAVAEVGDRWE